MLEYTDRFLPPLLLVAGVCNPFVWPEASMERQGTVKSQTITATLLQ